MRLNKKGFTLIEILVVVVIIAIVGALALPQYRKAVLKARFADMMSAVETAAKAQEAHFLAQGQYAHDLSLLSINYPDSLPAAKQPLYDDEGSLVYITMYDANGAELISYRRGLLQSDSTDFRGKNMCTFPLTQVGSIYEGVCQNVTQKTAYSWNNTDRIYFF